MPESKLKARLDAAEAVVEAARKLLHVTTLDNNYPVYSGEVRRALAVYDELARSGDAT